MIAIGIIGCNKKTETEKNPEPLLAFNCTVCSFIEGVSNTLNDVNYNSYIIKGTVLDTIEYGLKIRLDEDLKGNFPKKSTLIVWGNNGHSFIYDNLRTYNINDALIMHLMPVEYKYESSTEVLRLEKSGDYTTLFCASSVLMLSYDNVIGNIRPERERNAWWYNMSQEEQTSFLESLPLEEQQSIFMDKMPFDDFQKKINELLTK